MKNIIISVFLFALFLSGCGTKKAYFEPEVTDGELSYTKTLPYKITELSRHGATMQNGQIITHDGISDVVLPKGYSFLSKFENKIISSDEQGHVLVQDEKGNKIYEHKFEFVIASASIKNNTLALVDSSNKLMIVDIKTDKITYMQEQDKPYALDARIASARFLNTLVIFPTLDGKLVIVDWVNSKYVREIVISSEPFFNNVIYLNVLNNRLIAATAKRLISINPEGTVFYDDDIKDVMSVQDNTVVVSKDGKIVVLDKSLKMLKEHKFLFAVFVGISKHEHIYVAERNGHLIRTNMDFSDIKVYNLPDKIDALLYMNNDAIFYDKYMINLQK